MAFPRFLVRRLVVPRLFAGPLLRGPAEDLPLADGQKLFERGDLSLRLRGVHPPEAAVLFGELAEAFDQAGVFVGKKKGDLAESVRILLSFDRPHGFSIMQIDSLDSSTFCYKFTLVVRISYGDGDSGSRPRISIPSSSSASSLTVSRNGPVPPHIQGPLNRPFSSRFA